MMQTYGKPLAAICAILFIISSVIVLLLFNIERKAFSSETYKQSFENQKVYERMPEMLATALTEFMAGKQNSIPFLNRLTVQDWQASISILLPPEELKLLADNTLDSTMDYLNGKTDSAVISLMPLRTHLLGASGVAVVRRFLSLQPPCTAEQLTQMALGLAGGEIMFCNPPEEALGLMEPFIQTELHAIVNLIPPEIAFLPPPNSTSANDPRLKLNMVRSAIKLTPFIPALLLFGITLFAVRTLRDWLIWWGWPFILTGITGALVALIGSPLIGWILQLLIQNQGTIFIPPVLAASIGETTSAVARQMLAPVAIEGFMLGIIGLGMVVMAMFLPKRPDIQIIRYYSD